MAKTVRCTDTLTAGRLHKARQFWAAAQTIEALADDKGDIADASVTLAVHAGMAAADVICCSKLGQHARGDDHDEAVALLAQVNRPRANDLAALLRMKNPVGVQPRTDVTR